MRKIHQLSLCVLAGVLSAAGLCAQETVAQVEVSPETLMVGETAQYIIRFSGTTQLPNLMAPRVEGLSFADTMGTSSFRQVINGRVSVETRAIWNFSAVRPGNFTIPGRTVRISGNEVDIPPATVRAIPMDEETRSRTLLQLDMPDGPFYVGQAIPARLGLFIRNDISLSNIALPESSGDSFIHTEFDRNPARTRTRVEGRVYEAFVWDFIITPIKSGPAKLVFTQNIEIQVPTRDNRMPSIFNMTIGRTESNLLSTDTFEMEILPLPEEDQPDSFEGAIGTFTVTAKLSSRELMVGEPITLTLNISGEGNFDRISPPELGEWANWRVYPPKAEFTPADEAGFRGEKNFEYILIPQSDAITEVPGIAYAVFDPEARVYENTILDPEPVSVSPSDKPVNQSPFMPDFAPEEPTADRIPDSLLPLRPETGTLKPWGPPWRQWPFWSANLLVALLLLSIRFWQQRRRKLLTDSRHAQRHFGSRRIRKALAEARQAARDGDAAAFFAAARYAIQERTSHLSKSPVDAKTLVSSDCLLILKETKLPESAILKCSHILIAADACQFAGSAPEADKLVALSEDLFALITEMNRLQK